MSKKFSPQIFSIGSVLEELTKEQARTLGSIYKNTASKHSGSPCPCSTRNISHKYADKHEVHAK